MNNKSQSKTLINLYIDFNVIGYWSAVDSL